MTITRIQAGVGAANAIFRRHAGYRLAGLTLPTPGSIRGGDRIVARAVPGGFIVCVIDAQGHGNHAAPLADVMERIVIRLIAAGITSPEKILRILNTALLRRGAHGAAAILLCQGNRAIAATAAAPSPALYYGGRLERLNTEGAILGFFPNPYFSVCTREVPAGAFLALFTDGITDAENAVSETFSVERLAPLLDSERSLSANLLACVDTVLAHSEGKQDDDLSLLLAHAANPPAPVAQRRNTPGAPLVTATAALDLDAAEGEIAPLRIGGYR